MKNTKRIFLVVFLLFFYIFDAYAADNKQANHFLVLSDIHFNPFYTCSNNIPCPVIEKLRSLPAKNWDAILAQYDIKPSAYNQDTNYFLFQSALNKTKEIVNKKNIKFILILGDFLSHDYRDFYKKYSSDKSLNHYADFVRKTYEFLNFKFQNAFPATDLYLVVGNNDSYQDDYVSKPQGAFFQDVGFLWSQLIKNNINRPVMRKEFSNSGYYSVWLQPNVKLITLNSNLFSAKARGKKIDIFADAQLRWLHEQLSDLKNNQKALIALHIPMGVDIYSSLRINLLSIVEFWQPVYKDRFKKELSQFPTKIIAILAGHLHADWFQIIKPDGHTSIPIIGTPSISPVFGNNPGFKIFKYSGSIVDPNHAPDQNEGIENFKTFFYYLPQNVWQMEYNFSSIYLNHCQVCSIITGVENISLQGDLANYYKNFYATETESQPISTKWNPYYWCGMHTVDAAAYKECVDLHR